MRLLALLVCLLWSAPAWSTTFSAAAYESCMDGITAADNRLLSASQEEAPAFQEQAVKVRTLCVAEMESWLGDESLPSEDRNTIEGSFKGILAELSFILAGNGQCLQARGWLKKYKEFDETSSTFQKLKAAVEKCGAPEPEAKAATPAPQVTTPIIVNTTAAPLPVSPRSRALRNWGYGLLGLGVASGVGGFLYNSAGAEDRDEYDALNTACDATPATCDEDRVNTLAGSIDDAKMPIAALYGLAGVAALTGATFVTLDLIDGSDDRTARLLLSPNAVQVAVRW
ncbi:MAG: hypothetical protein HQ461_11300 [Deltaproteobacteria bacterium]|nr:hypothetical protein [Deltaproteobacteria bacterium]